MDLNAEEEKHIPIDIEYQSLIRAEYGNEEEGESAHDEEYKKCLEKRNQEAYMLVFEIGIRHEKDSKKW